MLGLPVGTLRAWEERYGRVLPERSAGRQRLFTRQQVEQLRHVKELIDAGLTPADAHRVLAEQIADGSETAAHSATDEAWREAAGASWAGSPKADAEDGSRPI
jgi:DNA-binding transcriptional MerR regulator